MTPRDLRPCHRRIEELKDTLEKRSRVADEMADEVERLCLRVKRQIDNRNLVISIEEVQDLIGRKR